MNILRVSRDTAIRAPCPLHAGWSDCANRGQGYNRSTYLKSTDTTRQRSRITAWTAGEWLGLMQSQPATQPTLRIIFHLPFSPLNDRRWLGYSYSAFLIRVLLEGVQSLLSDYEENGKAVTVGLPRKNKIRRSPARVHESSSQDISLSSTGRLETLLRWHVISRDAITSTPLLGKSICRRHNIEQHVWANMKVVKPGPDLTTWAHAVDADMLCGMQSQFKTVLNSYLVGAHSIHFQSSLFAAATV